MNPLMNGNVCSLNELRPLSKTLILRIYLPALAFLLILKLISMKTGIYMPYFTRDPLALAEAPVYYGFLSTIGTFIWFIPIPLCLTARALLKRHAPEFSRFMLATVGLNLLMLVDDIFLLHEVVYPEVFGIPEITVYGVYAILTFIFLVRFRLFMTQAPGVVLLGGFALFGLSGVFDQVFPSIRFQAEIEDGFKLLGILTWSYAYTAFAYRKMKPFFTTA